jgi:hypothetical protein
VLPLMGAISLAYQAVKLVYVILKVFSTKTTNDDVDAAKKKDKLLSGEEEEEEGLTLKGRVRSTSDGSGSSSLPSSSGHSPVDKSMLEYLAKEYAHNGTDKEKR